MLDICGDMVRALCCCIYLTTGVVSLDEIVVAGWVIYLFKPLVQQWQ